MSLILCTNHLSYYNDTQTKVLVTLNSHKIVKSANSALYPWHVREILNGAASVLIVQRETLCIYRHGAQRHFHLQAQDWRRAYLLLPGATFGSLREPGASCFLSISDKATQLDFPSEIWAATTWPSEEQCISQQ